LYLIIYLLLGFEVCALSSVTGREHPMHKIQKFFTFDDIPQVPAQEHEDEEDEPYYISSESESEDEGEDKKQAENKS